MEVPNWVKPVQGLAFASSISGLRATTTSAKDADSSPEFTINGEPNLESEFSDKLNGLVGTQLYVILANDTEVVLPVHVGFPGMPSASRTYSYGKRIVRTMSCL